MRTLILIALSLDVGAFTGSWAQHMVDRYDPVIYAFEPNPRSFELLQQKAVNNPKLQPKPYGLGDEDINRRLYAEWAWVVHV